MKRGLAVLAVLVVAVLGVSIPGVAHHPPTRLRTKVEAVHDRVIRLETRFDVTEAAYYRTTQEMSRVNAILKDVCQELVADYPNLEALCIAQAPRG